MVDSRSSGLLIALAAVVAVLSLTPIATAGQAAAAKALVYSPPRTPDGQPDVQGFWRYGGMRQASYNVEEGPPEAHNFVLGQSRPAVKSLVVDPADGKVPYKPRAAAKRKEIWDNHDTQLIAEYLDPLALCWLAGVPRINYQSELQIIQTPGQVVLLYEFSHTYRVIPIDGRPHVPDNIKLWMGDSRGRWEGNTLVVEVTNNNDKPWFDTVGTFHSDAVQMVERWTFVDADTINYEVTVEDPKVYTRPWKMAFPWVRNIEDGYEQMEHACHEGERDRSHMLSGGNSIEKVGGQRE